MASENIDMRQIVAYGLEEIKDDLDIDLPENGDLRRWARQGVLLLNATLTVRAHQAGSHQKKGWEDFTDAVIKILSNEKENLVFLPHNSGRSLPLRVPDKGPMPVAPTQHTDAFLEMFAQDGTQSCGGTVWQDNHKSVSLLACVL